MKTCTKCNQLLPISVFDYKSGNKKGLQNICKPCKHAPLKEHRQHMRRLVNRWKVMKGCSVCGFNGLHFQLDLDHIDPDTKHNSGNYRAYEPSWSKDKIKTELAKCVILCANCHRLKTFSKNEHLLPCDSPAHDENYN